MAFQSRYIKWSTSLFGTCLIFAGTAQAALVFDANAYSAGTDATNVVTGMTIEYFSHASGANSITYDPAIVESVDTCDISGYDCPANELDLYGNMKEFRPDANPPGETLGEKGDFSGVSFLFDQAISDFSLNAVTMYGDSLYMHLFDENDISIGYFVKGSDDPTTPNVGCDYCFDISFDTGDISSLSVRRIWIGSLSSQIWLSDLSADSISPSTVPVPASVWLFGSGLIGLIGIARRKA